jgi:hypothetical protein
MRLISSQLKPWCTALSDEAEAEAVAVAEAVVAATAAVIIIRP